MAHLNVVQRSLQTTLTQIGLNDNPQWLQSWNHAKSIIYHGGYFARAKEDLAGALAATAEAIAYVNAHPEIQMLANGPAPKDEPKAPALPKLTDATYARVDFLLAVDTLNVALAALVNDPAPDYRGPILGDLGGHRSKIIADIAQVGADLNNGITYYQATRGGNTGIITIPTTSSPLPDPKFGATTRTFLEAAQSALNLVAEDLKQTGGGGADPTQGGFVAKTSEAVQRASANVTAALAWLDVHPEAVSLKTGPAGPEPSPVRATKIPPDAPPGPSPGRGFNGPKLNRGTLEKFNEALGWLLNNPAPDHSGPVLGDLDGHRGKIMDAIGQASADTLAGIALTPAAYTAPRRGAALRGNPSPVPAPASAPSAAPLR